MGLRYRDINPAIPEDTEIFIDQEPGRIHSVYYNPKKKILELGTTPETLDVRNGYVPIWRMR